MAGLARKGMTFLQTKDVEEDIETEEADATEETTEDVAPVEKTEDIKDPREPQKKLLKSLGAEHDRHMGEVDKALDDFRTKAPGPVEDQPDQNDDQEPMDTNGSANHSEIMRDCIKNLRSAISDEHTMHKAETVKCFKSFEPTDEKKAFDRNKHLKAVRAENAEYEGLTNKALDEFEERCMKSMKTVQGEPGEVDDHTDWVTGIIETHARAHKKSLANIAKAMCREALGDSETTDAKTLEIVKAHIAPFIDAKNLTPVAIRIAAEITSENRKMLGEAHSQLKAASAIVEALHGALGNDDGEESRSVDDTTSSRPAPKKQRSRPTEDEANQEDELNTHLFMRDVLRGINTAAQEGLTKIKNDLKKAQN